MDKIRITEKQAKVTKYIVLQNDTGAPNENIIQNHLNIALLNVC